MKINAVFEGGGVRAIALAGAIKAAEEHGLGFHRMAGTSSGAIVSAFLAAGYQADEMKEIILEMPFSSFLQKGWLHWIFGIGPAVRLWIKKGLYSGSPLERWISEKLRKKGIKTFGDLEPGRLRIIASDITRGRMLVLPEDIRHYGMKPERLKVSFAVLMSASIPYFFEPVILKRNYRQSFYIVDGGLLSNFPLWLFDRHYKNGGKMLPTLGFYMVGKNHNKPNAIHGPISMFKALFSTMMGAHDERYIEKHARFRTVKIPTLGVHTTQFDLDRETALALYESGLQSGREFFGKWSLNQYLLQFEKVGLHSLQHMPKEFTETDQ